MRVALQIFWVYINEVKESGINPESRTIAMRSGQPTEDDENLINSMRPENGGFDPTRHLHLTEDGVLYDGERRLWAAKLAGLKEVAVTFSGKDAGKGMSKINGTKKEWKGIDWLLFYINEPTCRETIPSKFKKQLNTVAETAGQEGILFLRSRGQAADCISGVLKAVKRIAVFQKINVLTVLKWTVDVGKVNYLRAWLKNERDILELITCILENKPLPAEED